MHNPRADGTDPDPVGSKLPGKTLSKHENSGFGSPISGQRGQRKNPSRGGSHNDVPTLPTFNHPGNKRTQSVDNSPEVDVKHPPPVVLTGLKKSPSNSNPSIGHNKVGNPMLSMDVISNLPNSIPIRNVQLKSIPTHLRRGTKGSLKVNINTQHATPLRSKRDGGSASNPTTSPGNESKLPT